MRRVALCLAVLLPSAAYAQQVQISDGWVHATPPFQRQATGYVKLHSDTDDELVGAAIDTGGTATLESDGGKLGGIKLPAGKTVSLSPAGKQIALIGRNSPLLPGDRVGMTLYFKHAPPETVELNVLSQQNP